MALDLKDDLNLIDAYEQYHRPGNIWPEIPEGIRQAGVLDMQIYRIGTRLFMIVDHEENSSLAEVFGKMGAMPGQPEWAALMAGFQKTLPEAKPGEHWVAMTPVFLLNEHLK
jgi:L-rhamnose mutarotase